MLFALIIVGTTVWVARGDWVKAALCLGPLLWVIVAAGAGQYPLTGARVDFFLVPGLLVAACEGVTAIAAAVRQRWSIALIAAVLIGPMFWMDVTAVFLPRVRMNVRPVAEALRVRRKDNEPVFTGSCGDVLSWYWPDIPGEVRPGIPLAPTGAKTFWYVTAGKPENLIKDEGKILLKIDKHAREIGGDRLTVRGGAAFHFVEY